MGDTGSATREFEPSPWRDGRFVFFASGNFVNNIGEAIYAMALPLLVFELTGSHVVMSLLAALVPASLLLGPLLGVIVDHWGPRVMVVPGLLVQLGAAFVLNTGLAQGAPIWLLFISGALIQLGGAAYRAGWIAGIPAMFPTSAVRARGTLNSLFVATLIIGPFIVSVSLHWVSHLVLLWVNLATFVAPIAVWLCGVHPPRIAEDQRRRGVRIGSALAEGWRIIRAERRVVNSTLIGIPLIFVSGSAMTALVIYALRGEWHLTAGEVSVVVTLTQVGALIGNVLVSQRRRFSLRPVLCVVSLGMVVCLFAMSTPMFLLLLAALLTFFTLRGAFMAASQMMVIKYLPPAAIGRSMGILRLVSGLPDFLAGLVIPLILAGVGVRYTFLVLGVVALPSVLWLARTWSGWNPGRADPVPGVST